MECQVNTKTLLEHEVHINFKMIDTDTQAHNISMSKALENLIPEEEVNKLCAQIVTDLLNLVHQYSEDEK